MQQARVALRRYFLPPLQPQRSSHTFFSTRRQINALATKLEVCTARVVVHVLAPKLVLPKSSLQSSLRQTSRDPHCSVVISNPGQVKEFPRKRPRQNVQPSLWIPRLVNGLWDANHISRMGKNLPKHCQLVLRTPSGCAGGQICIVARAMMEGSTRHLGVVRSS